MFLQNLSEVKRKAKQFYSKNIDIIIEQYIKGTSITVPILNNFGNTKVLPFIIEQSNYNYNIITYKQKRKITGGLSRIVNADLQLQKILMKFHLCF